MLENSAKMVRLNFLIVFVVFTAQLLLAVYFTKSNLSLCLGTLLMFFLGTTTYLSVKLLLWGGNPIVGILVLSAKVPITIGAIYFLFKMPEYHMHSFLVGVLIVLPCLVILSYRNL